MAVSSSSMPWKHPMRNLRIVSFEEKRNIVSSPSPLKRLLQLPERYPWWFVQISLTFQASKSTPRKPAPSSRSAAVVVASLLHGAQPSPLVFARDGIRRPRPAARGMAPGKKMLSRLLLLLLLQVSYFRGEPYIYMCVCVHAYPYYIYPPTPADARGSV